MSPYSQQDRLLVALDSIIFGFDAGALNLLLIKRNFEPASGRWSLMGGFLRAGESLDAAASRVLEELTGLQQVYLEQFHVFGSVDRDPVERTISVGYYSLVNQTVVSRQLSDRYAAHWVPLREVPKLIFDHNAMVTTALARLRYQATHQPIGFELLPERFTLSQLQKLYEAIFDRPIDAGNFRRRIKKMDFIERLEEKDFSDSKRGAWYYRFHPERYAEALKNGGTFLLTP
ncbi:NUDIX domain-containing protein [Lewinella sp. 4G2]|uniref:NUDIX hydrolase n=1 Tax=Lewinella sp. 4G2 TaxID=1803372 RepID=UPI0007B4B5DC|nr:NUDIX domain-containing protein [Lewinella sp. 4G2]OAV45298.1 DNA mismatch repair protein MutT [Lewinella sp. 4G2]